MQANRFFKSGVNFIVRSQLRNMNKRAPTQFEQISNLVNKQQNLAKEAAATPSSTKSVKEMQQERAALTGEIRFTENITYDEEAQDVVPEIYREHRHKFSQQPEDLDAYKRQVMYRCAHIGTKELEIVLRDWLLLNQHKLSYAEVEQFDQEIVSMENPQMQRYLINGEQVLPEHDTKYMRVLLDYVQARKDDYHNNVPKDNTF